MRLNQKWFVDSTNSAVWWIKTHIYNLTVIRISVGAYKDAYEHGIDCIWLVVFVLSFKALTRQRHAPIFPIITMKQWNQYNHKHLHHQISLLLFTSLSMKRCMLFPFWHWQNAISEWARIQCDLPLRICAAIVTRIIICFFSLHVSQPILHDILQHLSASDQKQSCAIREYLMTVWPVNQIVE